MARAKGGSLWLGRRVVWGRCRRARNHTRVDVALRQKALCPKSEYTRTLRTNVGP